MYGRFTEHTIYSFLPKLAAKARNRIIKYFVNRIEFDIHILPPKKSTLVLDYNDVIVFFE